ncbi:MAG: REP-associated tyrosine transposase [Pseudomonas sp.]
MSNYRRPHEPGGVYFFTVVSQGRRPLLTTPEIRQALRDSIIQVRRHYPFRIHAWVLLPDHLHCLWELPSGDAAFGLRWALIKRGVSQRWRTLDPLNRSQQQRRENGLWQRRFWEHRIRNPQDYQRHMDYLHWNPVKHGLVERVADWPWSSFQQLAKAGVYPPDWGGDAGPPGSFGE